MLSRRRSLPRRNTEARPWEPSVKYGSNNPNRAHRRFSSILNASDPTLRPDDPAMISSTVGERASDVEPNVDFAAEETDHFETASENDSLAPLSPQSIVSTNLATIAPSSHESEGSGESISTEIPGKARIRRKRVPPKKPDAFSFLDSDSPTITPESIRRSMEEAARRSPTSTTSVQAQSPSSIGTSISSGFRDDTSENVGEHETDRSTSPERGGNGNEEGRPAPHTGPPRMPAPQDRQRSYAFPEFPRPPPNFSHTPPIDHAPREPKRGRPPPPPPRPERLPLTGYELLAARLSASSPAHNGPNLRPIYRRFETLNHRLLLYLQDEICELEEELHRLDALDTQNRRAPNLIFPASRRAECMAGGELYWRKAEILGKIGFKLDQYNRILSSFKETQGLPAPSMEDVHEYRSYLANHAPVAEAETRFLDNPDDLVCVSEDEPDVIDEDPVPTPIPMQMPMPMQMPIQHPTFPMSEPRSRSPSKPRAVSPYRRQEESSTVTGDDGYDEPPIIPLSVAVTVAVILPILTFLIIPGYPGRLTVVTLVGLSILGALIQGGIVAIRTWELLVCVGLYGAVMAVIAGIV